MNLLIIRLKTIKKTQLNGYYVYFGETDHMIPLQIDHQICWRKPFANATEALTKVVI